MIRRKQSSATAKQRQIEIDYANMSMSTSDIFTMQHQINTQIVNSMNHVASMTSSVSALSYQVSGVQQKLQEMTTINQTIEMFKQRIDFVSRQMSDLEEKLNVGRVQLQAHIALMGASITKVASVAEDGNVLRLIDDLREFSDRIDDVLKG